MINTIQLKTQQLAQGFFKTGTGKENILILGSCRAVPYVTYFNDWNNQNGNRFSIYYIDPFSFNWDMQENRVDYIAELIKQETNNELLNVLKSIDIFIHEHYANAEMFNCDKNGVKNIYQFGLNPKTNISLPGYNDIFVLTREIVSFDMRIRKMAIQDYNVTGKLSQQTINEIAEVSKNNLERFYKICRMTDFPEFADLFENDFKTHRYFYTFNHVSKRFNQVLFYMMNDKFLHLDLSNYKISEVDMFANNYTYLCEYDLGYSWNEQIKQLKEIL